VAVPGDPGGGAVLAVPGDSDGGAVPGRAGRPGLPRHDERPGRPWRTPPGDHAKCRPHDHWVGSQAPGSPDRRLRHAHAPPFSARRVADRSPCGHHGDIWHEGWSGGAPGRGPEPGCDPEPGAAQNRGPRPPGAQHGPGGGAAADGGCHGPTTGPGGGAAADGGWTQASRMPESRCRPSLCPLWTAIHRRATPSDEPGQQTWFDPRSQLAR
jgi:hypothetical protein